MDTDTIVADSVSFIPVTFMRVVDDGNVVSDYIQLYIATKDPKDVERVKEKIDRGEIALHILNNLRMYYEKEDELCHQKE